MPNGDPAPKYPYGLLDWAGHRSGGLRRLFYAEGNRPSGAVIRTRLLDRLEGWADSLASNMATVPKVVLLIGGPGNGKTEAVEFTVCALDRAFNLSNALIKDVKDQFNLKDGQPPPRLAIVELSKVSKNRLSGKLSILQDASVGCGRQYGVSHAELLVQDLEGLLTQHENHFYLACVNRGVLDDALIQASDSSNTPVQKLLECVIGSVELRHDTPACWPLAGYQSFAVWPMDVESLIEDAGRLETPAIQLLDIATNQSNWPLPDSCPARERCPYCTSRALLSGEPHRSSLLRALRWYELASGKRWSFRDFSSLVSFLLAGAPPSDTAASYDPCEWAAKLVALGAVSGGRLESRRLSAPFFLVAAQYQHALFGYWPRAGIRHLRDDLRDLQLLEEPALMGLYYFLANARKLSIPQTLKSQLSNLVEVLDPAIADPDMKVPVSADTAITFRDIDTRFSQSVGEGRAYIQKYHCLTLLEIDLLKNLEAADRTLSDEGIRRKRPAVAARVQALVRDFACRLVRRSIGVRAGVGRDALTLTDYQKVHMNDDQLLREAVRKVEFLLNNSEKFVVMLNVTFGEPMPPKERRAVLYTVKQRVKSLPVSGEDRPPAPVRFLQVGGDRNRQAIPLTYNLFKLVCELRKGMIPASLPRSVVALLDTTRARLSGQIVRDPDLLDGCEIRIGQSTDVITREQERFVLRQEEPE